MNKYFLLKNVVILKKICGKQKENMLKAKMDDEVRLQMFVSNIEEVLKGDRALMTLKDIDLVCIIVWNTLIFILVLFTLIHIYCMCDICII